MKILLVDDDAAVLDMMSRMLVHRGHIVHACDTPFGVSAQIVRDPPDVVVLDVMMPGLGGAALASLIAKLELPRAPQVVLWSAMDDTALAEAALEAGGLPNGSPRRCAPARSPPPSSGSRADPKRARAASPDAAAAGRGARARDGWRRARAACA